MTHVLEQIGVTRHNDAKGAIAQSCSSLIPRDSANKRTSSTSLLTVVYVTSCEAAQNPNRSSIPGRACKNPLMQHTNQKLTGSWQDLQDRRRPEHLSYPDENRHAVKTRRIQVVPLSRSSEKSGGEVPGCDRTNFRSEKDFLESVVQVTEAFNVRDC